MTVQIAPDIASKIEEKIATGNYLDADAVIREAMDLLEERDRNHAWLLAALAEGEQGDSREFTPELAEELFQSALKRAQAGELPSSDVWP